MVIGRFDGGWAPALAKELVERGKQVLRPQGSTEVLLAETIARKPAVLVLGGHPRALELRALARGLEAEPEVAVLVVDPSRPHVEVLVALASGITGYLPSGAGPVVAADAVRPLCAGGVVLPRATVRAFADFHLARRGITVDHADGALVELTHREWDVLVLVRQAYTTSEIAERLVVAAVTVRTHVAALVHKLGVRDRATLAEPLG